MARDIKRILISTMPRSGTVYFFNFIAELFKFSKLEPALTGGFRPSPPEWDPYKFDKTYKNLNDRQVLCAHYQLNEDIHAMLDQSDIMVIYLYRDPRDVAVSSALYIKYGLPHHFLHNMFQEMSDNEAITFMITGGIVCRNSFPGDMKELSGEYIFFEGMNYFIDNSYAWINDRRVISVRYEDFFKNSQVLIALAQKVGVKINSARIQELSLKLNFQRVASGRSRGEEDKASHFRKGLVGDHKNYFGELNNAVAKKIMGKFLIKYGYETSFNW